MTDQVRQNMSRDANIRLQPDERRLYSFEMKSCSTHIRSLDNGNAAGRKLTKGKFCVHRAW